jgi:hypothetical protein
LKDPNNGKEMEDLEYEVWKKMSIVKSAVHQKVKEEGEVD